MLPLFPPADLPVWLDTAARLLGTAPGAAEIFVEHVASVVIESDGTGASLNTAAGQQGRLVWRCAGAADALGGSRMIRPGEHVDRVSWSPMGMRAPPSLGRQTVQATSREVSLPDQALERRVRSTAFSVPPALARVQTALWSDEWRGWGLGTSAGARICNQRRTSRLLLRIETALGPFVDSAVADHPDALDLSDLLRRLEETLELAGQPRHRAPAGLPIALGPAVAAPLISALTTLLRGDVAAATPGWAQSVTRRIFPACLTLTDDPAAATAADSLRLDEEGIPVGPLVLIDGGRLTSFLHSEASAAAMGTMSNGRGSRRGSPEHPAPAATCLRVEAGTATLPEDCVELTTRVETFTSMPKAGVVTLIAAGFERRGGRRVRAIEPSGLVLPVLPTLRRLVGVAGTAERVHLGDEVATPTLIFDALELLKEGR